MNWPNAGVSYGDTGVKSRVIVAHRRAGKSWGIVFKLVRACSELLLEKEIYILRRKIDSHTPRFGFLAETREHARQILWLELTRYLSKFPGVKFNNTTLSITIPRPRTKDNIIIDLKAHRYHNSIRGLKYRELFVDEAQMVTETALHGSIFSTLAESAGRLNLTATACNEGYFPEYVRWAIRNNVCHILPVSMTDVFSVAEQRAILEKIGVYAYRQEYMCDFSAPDLGTFYAELLNTLEKRGGFFSAVRDPSLCLVMGVDIGVGEGFAAWVAQIHPDGTRVDMLDFYSGYELLNELYSDMESDGLLPDVIFIPFDSEVRRLETIKPRNSFMVFEEIFPESLILPLQKATARMKEIEVVKRHLHLLHFPPEKDYSGKELTSDASTGLKKLKNYRRKVDADKRVLDQIAKNGADHVADALRYLFVGLDVAEGKCQIIPMYRRAAPPLIITNRTNRKKFFVNTKGRPGHRGDSEINEFIAKAKAQQAL